MDTPRQDTALTRYLGENDVACERCGYNLRGIHDPWCPECGYVVPCPVEAGPRSTPPDRWAWLFWTPQMLIGVCVFACSSIVLRLVRASGWMGTGGFSVGTFVAISLYLTPVATWWLWSHAAARVEAMKPSRRRTVQLVMLLVDLFAMLAASMIP